MRKSQGNRDAIKEFLESVVPLHALSLATPAKGSLPARARPGLSAKSRAGSARRFAPICVAN
jgi:hypothetical protein